MGITTTARLVFHYFSNSPNITEETWGTGEPLTANYRIFGWPKGSGSNLLKRDLKGSVFQNLISAEAGHRDSFNSFAAISSGNSGIQRRVKTCCSTSDRFVRMLLAIPHSDLAGFLGRHTASEVPIIQLPALTDNREVGQAPSFRD
jgi:hypothetical protein